MQPTLDIDRVLLSWRTDLSDDPPASRRSWIQVAKTGEFTSTRYGKFSITRDELATMVRNFRTAVPLSPTQLPVDYDHLSMDPKKPGDGIAAGWFTGLELRNDGDELWGEVEWTPPAAQRIANREYRFVSPSFVKQYTSKFTGKQIGATLLAAAITNRPFLEGMQALSLSADPAAENGFAFDKPKGEADEPPAHEAAESTEEEAAEESAEPSPSDGNEDGETSTNPAPQEPPSRHGVKHMSNVINMKDAEGKDVAFSADSLREQLKSLNLSDLLPDGTVIMAKADLDASNARVATLETQVTNLSSSLAGMARAAESARVTAQIDSLISEGRISRPQRDWAVKHFADAQTIDLASFDEWKSSVPAAGVIKLNTVHGIGVDAAEPQEVAPQAKILAKANELVKEQKIELRDAIIQASAMLASESGDYLDAFRPTVN